MCTGSLAATHEPHVPGFWLWPTIERSPWHLPASHIPNVLLVLRRASGSGSLWSSRLFPHPHELSGILGAEGGRTRRFILLWSVTLVSEGDAMNCTGSQVAGAWPEEAGHRDGVSCPEVGGCGVHSVPGSKSQLSRDLRRTKGGTPVLKVWGGWFDEVL